MGGSPTSPAGLKTDRGFVICDLSYTIRNVPVNDVAAPQATGWTSLLDWLWRMLASPRLTVILLVWIAVVLALSTVIPQAPPHIEDPIIRSQWLADVPIGIRPVAERLRWVGVFDMFNSIWLRLPLVFLLAHVLVITASSAPSIWQRVKRPPGEAEPLGKSFQLKQDWPESNEHAGQQLISRLREGGYHILSVQRDDTQGAKQDNFVAWRWRWSWLGLAGIYLGLGLASLGLVLAGWLGEAQELNLTTGKPVPLPVTAPSVPNLVLEEATVTGDDPLGPAIGTAVFRISTGVGESQVLALKLHGSRLLRGRWVTLTALKPVVEITAVDAATGESVLLQPFTRRTPAEERVRLPLTTDPETRFVGVPSQNVTLHVDYQVDAKHRSGAREILTGYGRQAKELQTIPEFSLAFFHGAEPEPRQEEFLHSGDTVNVDGVRYLATFGYDATLRMNSALWWIAVAAGWGMVTLSFITLVVAPPVYIQGSVESAEKGNQVSLTVDILGDEQRRRRELQGLIAPAV
jgi:hypothetical protein